MTQSNGVTLPGESEAYRKSRAELLEAEKGLRREIERVASLRRALPPGGAIPEDYVFDEIDSAGKRRSVAMSDLFVLPDKSLFLYSLMYPEGASPCPMCTSFLDSLNGVARHAKGQVNLAVVARGGIEQIARWAAERKWDQLRLLSSARNDYHPDYLSEMPDGAQIPMINVFRNTDDGIRHFYATELFFSENEPGQHPRHVDMLFPLWNLFDLTPEGRPSDWFPQLSYSSESSESSGATEGRS